MNFYKSIQAAWRAVEKDNPNQDFLKIPSLESDRFVNYKIGTFYKRISRLCSAFRSGLKMRPGETVAIMTERPNDMALLFHSLWLGCFTALPVDMTLSDQRIVELFENCKVSVAVFPLEYAARVAGLISRCPGVKHWLVCGTSSFVPSNSGMRKLDELMASTAGFADEFDDRGASDFTALITFTKGSAAAPYAVKFTQAQLVAAAQSSVALYPKDKDGQAIWSLLPPRGLNGIIQGFLAPLFTQIPAVLNYHYELKDFWELVQTNEVSFVLMDQPTMRYLNRRGKTRNWVSPESFGIGLFSNEVLSKDLIVNFQKKFPFPIVTCYSQTELGGVVSLLPWEKALATGLSEFSDEKCPSSGVVGEEIELQIQDKFGEDVGPGELGEIVVKSKQNMNGYVADTKGNAYFSDGGWLHTGDEGFCKFDSEGKRHLFVTGRFEEFVVRENSRINLGVIDTVLLEIKGVDFAKAVGFPNASTGVEIGAYIMPLRASNVSEKEIMAALREKLPWAECPKVLIVGDAGKATQRSFKRQDLVRLFEEYSAQNFVEGLEG